MQQCRWRDDLTQKCNCGYSRYIGREVDDDVCEICVDNTEKEYVDEHTESLLGD